MDTGALTDHYLPRAGTAGGARRLMGFASSTRPIRLLPTIEDRNARCVRSRKHLAFPGVFC